MCQGGFNGGTHVQGDSDGVQMYRRASGGSTDLSPPSMHTGRIWHLGVGEGTGVPSSPAFRSLSKYYSIPLLRIHL